VTGDRRPLEEGERRLTNSVCRSLFAIQRSSLTLYTGRMADWADSEAPITANSVESAIHPGGFRQKPFGRGFSPIVLV
jgi:hypothetical protein